MNNTIRHIVLNTIAGSAADLIVKNQITYLSTHYLGRYLDYEPWNAVKETAITAETPGVVTITPPGTPVASTTYSFVLIQLIPGAQGSSPKRVQKTVSVTTAAVAPNATALCDQFRSEYFAGQSSFNVVASGGATLILTAAAGSPYVSVKEYRSDATSYMTVSDPPTTPGIDTRGTPTDMQALGVSSALTTGTAYTLYGLRNNQHVGNSNRSKVNQAEDIYIWLNETEDETAYAALVTRMDEWYQSFASGGSTVDPEIIATAD